MEWLTGNGWVLEGEPIAENASQKVSVQLRYPVERSDPHLRPHLKLEIIFKSPRLDVIHYPVGSFIAQLSGTEAEIKQMACLDIHETALEKVSALCWRLQPEHQEGPELVRHLHDLACLSDKLTIDAKFSALLFETVREDLKTRAGIEPSRATEILQNLPESLSSREEAYTNFVRQASYATDEQIPSFTDAITKFQTLIDAVM